MFCRNCGNEIDPNAAFCVKCGYQKGSGNSFCQNCGEPTDTNAVVCTKCGFAIAPQANGEQKSKIVAGLLGIFLGSLGVHNFYLGYTNKAIVQLLISILSCGILAIVSSVWGLVEGIQILTGSINKDVKGIPLKD